MTAFSEDPSRFKVYEEIADDLTTPKSTPRVFEWSKGMFGVIWRSFRRLTRTTLTEFIFKGGNGEQRSKDVDELIASPTKDFRVIFTDLDLPIKAWLLDFQTLCSHYSIPSAFVPERIQAVSHSFGTKQDAEGGECIGVWFHFLCKSIKIKGDGIAGVNLYQQPDLPGADNSWLRSAYFLRFKKLSSQPDPSQSRLSTGSASAQLYKEITLICFGAPESLEARFKTLLQPTLWESVLSDPYIVFDVIMDDLYLQLDQSAWNLRLVYNTLERNTMASAMSKGSIQSNEFIMLHNIAKHHIHLVEAADAALATLDSICTHHRRHQSGLVAETTYSALLYRTRLFKSTRLRLGSFEKRIANTLTLVCYQNIILLLLAGSLIPSLVIDLTVFRPSQGFHVITQRGNHIMQEDSSSMKTIAMATLFFLPATAVASIFSSAFFSFNVDDDGSQHFVLSQHFWVFWAVSIPLTAVVYLSWKLWHTSDREASVKVGGMSIQT